jgi:signal transduction histidine kinase
MNAILGYSQILRRDPNLPAKYQPSIETIERSGDHLLSMINDILDLSKIEAGKMELQTADFDLCELIQGLSAMFELRCQQRRLGWRVEWDVAQASSPASFPGVPARRTVGGVASTAPGTVPRAAGTPPEPAGGTLRYSSRG